MRDLVTGISRAIFEEFGEDYEINVEELKQDLNTPCFLILLLNTSRKQIVDKLYKETHYFDIHFFPSDDNPKMECLEVQERLYNILEYIKANEDLVRGTDLKANITDDVLHFFVSYDYDIIKTTTDEIIYMEDLERMVKPNARGN